MLEFITTLELKPNTEILELIKDFNYTINKGKIKHLLKTNKKSLYQELLIKDKLTIYKKNEEKIRIEKVFGNNYSLDRINEKISKSMYKYFKPMLQKTIYQQYLLKSK